MNKLLITLAGALALGAALPAFAGPDFQAIEQARKARHERLLAQKERAEARARTLTVGPSDNATASPNKNP